MGLQQKMPENKTALKAFEMYVYLKHLHGISQHLLCYRTFGVYVACAFYSSDSG